MNQFRVTVRDAVTDALILHSTIDRTHKLTGRTDELCVIGRDDVCVLKNYAERPAVLDFTGDRMQSGRTIFRPSRQQSFTLYQGREQRLVLGAGESCVIRCEKARDPRNAASGAMVTA